MFRKFIDIKKTQFSFKKKEKEICTKEDKNKRKQINMRIIELAEIKNEVIEILKIQSMD